jgi:hypothetical protein
MKRMSSLFRTCFVCCVALAFLCRCIERPASGLLGGRDPVRDHVRSDGQGGPRVGGRQVDRPFCLLEWGHRLCLTPWSRPGLT